MEASKQDPDQTMGNKFLRLEKSRFAAVVLVMNKAFRNAAHDDLKSDAGFERNCGRMLSFDNIIIPIIPCSRGRCLLF